jgi:hypothetical protein
MESKISISGFTIAQSKGINYLFALLSLSVLSSVGIHKIDLASLNPFQNNPKTTSVAAFNPNASQAVSDVVTNALAFKAMLTSTQQTTLEKTYTTTLAKKWSNLPCGSGCRNGIQFSTLTATQLTAAKLVIQSATGASNNHGYDLFTQILKADTYLGANGGGSGYSEGIYFIAFLNTPSTTGAWMLQFGGHHYAFNIAFNGGQVVGTTPQMVGVEPLSFTQNSVTYTPMTTRHDVMTAMLAGLTTTQLTSAKLTSTFSDCLMSPGESNGNTNTMPTTKQGLICSGLSATQKNLVLAAIQTWTDDMDSDSAATLLSIYTNEIDNTYIAWTGSGTSGSASTFLNANTNYVRIDGPSVWIEFVCQNGVVFTGIHYHSVWRDHIRDYGSNLTATSLLGNAEVTMTKPALKLYPNPASDTLGISLGQELTNATVTITDMTGKVVLKKSNISDSQIDLDISSIANGNYIVKVVADGKSSSAKFIKK